MPTYSALTTLHGRDQAEALGIAMERLTPEPTGVGVFEIEDGSGLWEVGGYFMDPPDDIALSVLAAAFSANSFVVSEVPDVDWVAKVRRELSPVEAGRFFVYGSHDADKVPEGRIALLIEASMAFGTGHHGTTLGCLRALDHLIDAGFEARQVIDVGCGTAVLAMAAAKVWSHPVLASDIDPVAVDVARANAVANGLAEQVRCIEATGLDHPDILSAAPFDLVFANILKAPLMNLAPSISAATCAGGYAILSGLLNDQTQDVVKIYAKNGYKNVWTDSIGEWSALIMKKSG
ncbi:50S ribosomal protein L11 methyltransferase [Pseudaestuariivita rosea]|uniref:50S ribosomal protein L11 methyltransferase n=1 Tax=Pseudaestuariivita rosea TaxID=2763263 RepID=UPI001ABACB02|nr:50S ribosomal protein L11 methyltransferase [Pseudaestuariivita rosea]